MKYLTVCFAFITCVIQIVTSQGCPPNEVRSECDVPCQPTCSDPYRVPCPTFACGTGSCVCALNFIRRDETGECIRRTSCPRTQNADKTDKSCPNENEEFTTCGSLCPTTCQSPCKESTFCPAMCVQMCDCVPGFIRDEVTTECILPEDCPTCEHQC